MKRRRPIRVTALEALDRALPTLDADAMGRWMPEVTARPLRYPIGSGQGNELAVRAGLRPMMRELIATPELSAAIARHEAAGLVCELSPLVFGTTKDGWLERPPAPDGSEDRRPLYVGRDRAALRAAIDAEIEKTDDGIRALGAALGYPQCCVEAFVGVSRERRGHELVAAAWSRTEGRPAPRLDVSDLAVFAFVPWYPCSFRCAPSLAFADQLAALVRERHPEFVAAIDAAHATHRLILAPEVQLALDGSWNGRGIENITRLWAASIHRDPRARIDAQEHALILRAVAWLEGTRTIGVRDGALVVDGTTRAIAVPTPLPILVPFGS